MSEKNLEQMGRLFEGVEPTDELNEQVLARVHELRAAEAARVHERRPHVTRRAALAGAAGCAVVAGLALGLPALLGTAAGGNSFGLAIAQAAEGTGVTVTSGPDGLMPYENDTRAAFSLKLNLSAVGGNISSVTYRIEGSPVLTNEGPDARTHSEYPAVSMAQGSTHAASGSGVGNPANVIGEARQQLSIERCDAVTVDYAQREGTSDYQPTDDVLNFVSVYGRDGVWEVDPTLRLMRAWLDLVVLPIPGTEDGPAEGETIEEFRERARELAAEVLPEREAAHQAFLDSFNDIAADDATFYAWLRNVYVSGFELAAAQLAEARLVADVSFDDGSEATRSYRVTLADGHEQTLADRFDALCELDGNAGVEQARSQQVPWVSLPTPTDEQVAADARLSAPIFVIEDVTEP
ncbi:hypothetical protein [Olsenella profusa]|uniref:DUF4179 domain-containing protein n=1 Tax=Olsenella profusa TaxID=138595 RepID=A0ABS2F2L9_9ACTN|nr:hypothetical protein [Olsenella profusa]MBM6775037.1 hypothetical protein [Olsenella profusa]